MSSKKIIIIPIVVGIIAFVVGFFVGDSTAINRVNKKISASVPTNVPKAENIKTDTPKKEEKPKEVKAIGFNQAANAGYWNLKVLEVKETDTIKARDKYDKDITTDGKFLILKLEMKNIHSAPVQYGSNDFALKDTKNNSVYQIEDNSFKVIQSLNATETIYNKNNSFVGVYADVNPGMTKSTYIAFEVPKDASIENFKLGCINDGNPNSPVFFDLK